MRRTILAAVLAATFTSIPGSSFLDAIRTVIFPFWAVPATTDEGCGFDPDGRCRQVQIDAGCGFDPSGRCRPAAQAQPDAGCGFDPNGRCQPGS